MPLVPIDRILGLPSSPPDSRRSEQVIVLQHGTRSVGLVVGEIRDIVEESFELQPGTASHGIVGSAIIQGRITDLIDVAAVLHTVGLTAQPRAA